MFDYYVAEYKIENENGVAAKGRDCKKRLEESERKRKRAIGRYRERKKDAEEKKARRTK